MTHFHGVFPYLVSPIDRDGRVKADVLARLVDDLIAAGVHGLTPLGSTGEFAYLDREQRAAVVKTTISAAAGRVPVVAGVASTSTADAVAQAQNYQQLGADGVLAILEAYFPLKNAQVESYFRAIADAVDIPVVLYTNPQFQRSDLSLDVIARLAEHARIRYIKDASNNTGRLLSIMNRCGGNIAVFSASAHIPAAVMLIGGVGWMAGPACIIPRQSVALYDLCRAGKWPEAMELQRRLWRINEAFARFNLAACIKAGLELQGYEIGDPVPPQPALTVDERRAVAAALAEVASVTTGSLCPACGYDLGFAAWNADSPSHEICPSCGIQFGYDDSAGGAVDRREQVYRDWRKKWIAGGMRWHSRGKQQPGNWSPLDQLRAARLQN